MQNASGEDLTIDSVSLVGSNNLRIQSASITPIFNHTLIGTVPPTPEDPAWRERIPARGAVIPAKQDRDLVLVLSISDSRNGEADDLEVLYHGSGGRAYVFRANTALRIVASSSCL